MKAAFIVAFITVFISMVIAQTTPYYITNPIQGSSFAAGDSVALQWNNGVGTAKVTVLTGTNAATMNSAGITFNINGADGEYDWTVPKNLPQNATFAFQIDYKDTNNVAGTVYSAPFTLTGTTGPVVTQSFVSVISTAAPSSSPVASLSMVSVSAPASSSVVLTTAITNATATASPTSATVAASTTPTPAKSAAVAGFKAPTAAVCIVALIASALFL